MSRLLGAVDWLSDRAGKAVGFLVVFMVAAMTYEVVARYALNSPTIWARETVQFLLGGYAILGGAYVLRHKGHVSMDILYDRLSLRRRAILDLVTSSFFFLFCGVLLWYGVDYAWSSFSVGETTGSTWNPPEGVIKATIPVGAALIILQGLAKFVRDLIAAVKGAAPE
jgi:TRAP-type mannitol/chloroaromatic compound transport system permease small subunit